MMSPWSSTEYHSKNELVCVWWWWWVGNYPFYCCHAQQIQSLNDTILYNIILWTVKKRTLYLRNVLTSNLSKSCTYEQCRYRKSFLSCKSLLLELQWLAYQVLVYKPEKLRINICQKLLSNIQLNKDLTFWQYFFKRSLSFACCSNFGSSRNDFDDRTLPLSTNSDSICFFRW